MQAKEGQWYLIARRKFKHKCCDCGLEHKVELQIVDHKKKEVIKKYQIGIRFFRNL